MAFGLARFDLTTLTARLELPAISADPAKPITLIVRFMGVGNRDWEAWRFARDAAVVTDETVKKPVQQRLAERRAEMRDSLAVVLAGWEHVLDDSGQPVAFSADAAVRFVAEVHDAVPVTLGEIADFVSTRSHFVPVVAATIDPVALGKDAPRG